MRGWGIMIFLKTMPGSAQCQETFILPLACTQKPLTDSVQSSDGTALMRFWKHVFRLTTALIFWGRRYRACQNATGNQNGRAGLAVSPSASPARRNFLLI